MPAAISEPPKPAAPSPSPTPAPAPAPSPAPAPAPKSSADAFDDQFADLDAPPSDSAPKPAAPAKADKPEPKAAAKPATPKPEPKEPAEPAPEPTDEFEPPAVAKPSELRGWALRQAKRAKKAEGELTQLRERVQQLESTPQTNGGPDHKVLAEQLAQANKRIEEYEQEVRLTKYERSQEYRDKWERPYQDAIRKAYRDVKELLVTVREPNPEDAEHPIERERPATEADFEVVYSLPLGAATRKAKELFGDSYATVINHRNRIKEIQEGAYGAIEEYRNKGSEQEKQSEARSKQEQAFIESAWQKANDSMRTKGAEFFDERPDDDEGNALLKKGMDHAELAFDGEALSRYPLPQQIAVHARIKNWAGSFLRNRRDIMQLKAQLAEANTTIEQLRGSGPGKPEPVSDKPAPSANKTLMEEFDERVK